MLKRLQEEVKRRTANNDSAHDFGHIMRVLKNAQRISSKEKADQRIITAAVLLHDIISYPKSDPRSKNSSIQSAKTAKKILARYHFKKNEIYTITEAIRTHSFSRGETPNTLEGKILQDADRLDAIGAIGIARAFSVGGSEMRLFYNNKDPFCKIHIPNDRVWTLDHFYKKLLLVEKKMNTKTAKIEAKRRSRILKRFLEDLKQEI